MSTASLRRTAAALQSMSPHQFGAAGAKTPLFAEALLCTEAWSAGAAPGAFSDATTVSAVGFTVAALLARCVAGAPQCDQWARTPQPLPKKIAQAWKGQKGVRQDFGVPSAQAPLGQQLALLGPLRAFCASLRPSSCAEAPMAFLVNTVAAWDFATFLGDAPDAALEAHLGMTGAALAEAQAAAWSLLQVCCEATAWHLAGLSLRSLEPSQQLAVALVEMLEVPKGRLPESCMARCNAGGHNRTPAVKLALAARFAADTQRTPLHAAARQALAVLCVTPAVRSAVRQRCLRSKLRHVNVADCATFLTPLQQPPYRDRAGRKGELPAAKAAVQVGEVCRVHVALFDAFCSQQQWRSVMAERRQRSDGGAAAEGAPTGTESSAGSSVGSTLRAEDAAFFARHPDDEQLAGHNAVLPLVLLDMTVQWLARAASEFVAEFAADEAAGAEVFCSILTALAALFRCAAAHGVFTPSDDTRFNDGTGAAVLSRTFAEALLPLLRRTVEAGDNTLGGCLLRLKGADADTAVVLAALGEALQAFEELAPAAVHRNLTLVLQALNTPAANASTGDLASVESLLAAVVRRSGQGNDLPTFLEAVGAVLLAEGAAHAVPTPLETLLAQLASHSDTSCPQLSAALATAVSEALDVTALVEFAQTTAGTIATLELGAAEVGAVTSKARAGLALCERLLAAVVPTPFAALGLATTAAEIDVTAAIILGGLGETVQAFAERSNDLASRDVTAFSEEKLARHEAKAAAAKDNAASASSLAVGASAVLHEARALTWRCVSDLGVRDVTQYCATLEAAAWQLVDNLPQLAAGGLRCASLEAMCAPFDAVRAQRLVARLALQRLCFAVAVLPAIGAVLDTKGARQLSKYALRAALAGGADIGPPAQLATAGGFYPEGFARVVLASPPVAAGNDSWSGPLAAWLSASAGGVQRSVAALWDSVQEGTPASLPTADLEAVATADSVVRALTVAAGRRGAVFDAEASLRALHALHAAVVSECFAHASRLQHVPSDGSESWNSRAVDAVCSLLAGLRGLLADVALLQLHADRVEPAVLAAALADTVATAALDTVGATAFVVAAVRQAVVRGGGASDAVLEAVLHPLQKALGRSLKEGPSVAAASLLAFAGAVLGLPRLLPAAKDANGKHRRDDEELPAAKSLGKTLHKAFDLSVAFLAAPAAAADHAVAATAAADALRHAAILEQPLLTGASPLPPAAVAALPRCTAVALLRWRLAAALPEDKSLVPSPPATVDDAATALPCLSTVLQLHRSAKLKDATVAWARGALQVALASPATFVAACQALGAAMSSPGLKASAFKPELLAALGTAAGSTTPEACHAALQLTRLPLRSIHGDAGCLSLVLALLARSFALPVSKESAHVFTAATRVVTMLATSFPDALGSAPHVLSPLVSVMTEGLLVGLAAGVFDSPVAASLNEVLYHLSRHHVLGALGRAHSPVIAVCLLRGILTACARHLDVCSRFSLEVDRCALDLLRVAGGRADVCFAALQGMPQAQALLRRATLRLAEDREEAAVGGGGMGDVAGGHGQVAFAA